MVSEITNLGMAIAKWEQMEKKVNRGQLFIWENTRAERRRGKD